MYCKEMLPEDKVEIKHPETKECPFCKNEIKYEAIKCMYCKEMLNNNEWMKIMGYLKWIWSQIKWRMSKRKDKKTVEEKKIENKVMIVEENNDIEIEKNEGNVKREYSWETIKFRSRTWIYIYFIIISAVFAWGLYMDKEMTVWIIIFLTILFIELWLFLTRRKNYIKVEKNGFEICEYIWNPVKPEIIKIKYDDIKIINFKNSKRIYWIWYVLFWWYYYSSSYADKHTYSLKSDIVLFTIFLIIFIFHTIPLIIFRRNCSNVEIETKDWKIVLPKISWKKKLMEILEEVKIHYTY